MNENSSASGLFEPKKQDLFWKALSPDIRVAFDTLESKEHWTYKYQELPEFFIEMAEKLPILVNDSLNPEAINDLIQDLIILLAQMPFRLCLSAISWLDNNSGIKMNYGWGIVLKIQTHKYANLDNDSLICKSSKVINERVNILIKTKMATELFINNRSWAEQ